jgi:hypothetical protein
MALTNEMLFRVKPLDKLVLRVNLDECSPHEIIWIVALVPAHSSQLVLVDTQHRVVETLWMSQNSTTTANQVEMTFRYGKLKLQVKQILVRTANERTGNNSRFKMSPSMTVTLPEILFLSDLQNVIDRAKLQLGNKRRILSAEVAQRVLEPAFAIENL